LTHEIREKYWLLLGLLPERRFDPGFPLALWFAGLWFYLKGFLYLCYLYMIGVEPMPFPPAAQVEIVYFACAFIPSFLLGLAMWNEKRWVTKLAVVFLAIDTPFLLFHVFRLAWTGALEAGLTSMLEYGSLGLNLVALGWLVGYLMGGKPQRT